MFDRNLFLSDTLIKSILGGFYLYHAVNDAPMADVSDVMFSEEFGIDQERANKLRPEAHRSAIEWVDAYPETAKAMFGRRPLIQAVLSYCRRDDFGGLLPETIEFLLTSGMVTYSEKLFGNTDGNGLSMFDMRGYISRSLDIVKGILPEDENTLCWLNNQSPGLQPLELEESIRTTDPERFLMEFARRGVFLYPRHSISDFVEVTPVVNDVPMELLDLAIKDKGLVFGQVTARKLAVNRYPNLDNTPRKHRIRPVVLMLPRLGGDEMLIHLAKEFCNQHDLNGKIEIAGAVNSEASILIVPITEYKNGLYSSACHDNMANGDASVTDVMETYRDVMREVTKYANFISPDIFLANGFSLQDCRYLSPYGYGELVESPISFV